ncbi:hypothetical protein D9M71_361260 [compost metagenome]
MHCRGNHFGHFLLTPRAVCGVLHNLGHQFDRTVQAFAGVQDLADEVALAVEKAVEPASQVAQFIRARRIQALGQVTATITNRHERPGDPADRPDNATGQQHHQQQRHQRHAGTNQAGQPHRLAHRGIDLRFRYFSDQSPVQVAQRQAQGQVVLAVTLEAAAVQAFGSVQDSLGGRLTDLLGKLGFATQLLLRMNLDQAIAAHQKHPAALTETEVVDQFRQFGHAQAEPGNADQFSGLFHPVVDEQCQFTGTAIGVDVEQARIAAVDEAKEPFVGRIAAAQRTIKAFLVVVMVAFSGGEQRREGLVFLPQRFEVLDKLRRLGSVFARRQPVAQ